MCSKDVTDVKRPRDVERDLPTDYRPRKKVDDRDRERQDESRRYKELLWKWEMHERLVSLLNSFLSGRNVCSLVAYC